MLSLTVKKNDADQRLDRFILKMLPDLSRATIFKMIRTKKIKVNGKKTSFDTRLNEKDVITIDVKPNTESPVTKSENYDFLKAADKIKIEYHDDNIIVVDKPVGLIVHSDNKHEYDTLINRVLKYLYKFKYYDPAQEQSFRPSLAHRLDLNTAGLIVVAKTAEALRELNDLFKENKIERRYLAMLHGNIQPKQNEVKVYLKKSNDNTMLVSNYQTNDNKVAITKYTQVAFIDNRYSLVDVQLLTGRTHQIRATFNYLGYPLVGEQKYTSKKIDKNPNFAYQCLASYYICFHVAKNSLFGYLNNQPFQLGYKDIWFLKDVKQNDKNRVR